MICPNCHTENKDGAKFCNECGSRFDHMSGISAKPDIEGEACATSESVEDDFFVEVPSFDDESISEEEPVSDDPAPDISSGAEVPPSEIVRVPDISFSPAFNGSPVEDDGPATSPSIENDDALNVPPEQLVGLDVDSPVLFDCSSFDDAPLSAHETNELEPVRESVVDAHYQTPQSAWASGGTMEMDKVEAGVASSTSFRAPDPNDRKRRKKEARELRKARKAAEKANGEGGSSPVARVSIVAGLVAIVAVAVAFGTYSMELWGGKTIPGCTGMTQADAVYLLESEGFSVKIDYVLSDDTEGLVLLTDPAAGKRIEVGSEIQLHVAQGRVVPEVIGKSQEAALAALSQAGYDSIDAITYVKSDEYDDVVVSVTPDQGSKAKSSAKVSLTVAQAYTVPETAGMTGEAAIAELQGAGYLVSVSYLESSTVAEGYTVSTYPEAGAKVESGSVITLNVSQARSTRLQKAAQDYLSGLSTISLGVTSYEITSVTSVSYLGENRVSFTLMARPFMTFLGEIVYLSDRPVSGVITFDDNDNVVSVVGE